MLAGIVVLARLPGLVAGAGGRVADGAAAIGRVLREPPAERIQRTTAISPEFVAAVRSGLPPGGRLVIYGPYPGPQFEGLVRQQFERVKNLLYPAPRDVVYALSAAELGARVTPDFEGRLLVVDGTQEPVELTAGGRYELVHSESIGGAGRLRLWRLVKAL